MATAIDNYCRYMEKDAFDVAGALSGLTSLFTASGELTSDAVIAGLTLSMLAGGGGGYLASRLTSPSRSDIENIQSKFMRDKVERELALRRRESKLAAPGQAYLESGRPEVVGRSLHL